MDKVCNILEINQKSFDLALNSEIENQVLFEYIKKERKFLYLKQFFIADTLIARRFGYMKKSLYNNQIDFNEVINIDERQNNIKYGDLQRKAINEALSKGVMILTGGPGTGKTTTLNAIISLFSYNFV